MKNQKQQFLLLATFILVFNIKFFAQDPNFYIFLCFGQSNMEGQGAIEAQDTIVSDRFQVYQSLDCPKLDRKKGQWYTAVPPLSQCNSKLSPADYFGRTLVEQLPDSIKIGVINVAVGGSDIRLFDKDLYKDYDKQHHEPWFASKIDAYGGNPYEHLIELAKEAQEHGLIKGILLHQGETNTGQENWPLYVQKIYNDMLSDLNLRCDAVPLLAGELLSTTDNCCSRMNPIINTLPEVIPSAHVISSEGCPGKDRAHFNSEGNRMLGRRYGLKMLSLLGYEPLEE